MKEEKIYSIIVIDDHPLIHNGLKTLLATEKNIIIAASCLSGAEAMQQLQKKRFDLAIVDLSLSDSDGTYLVQRINAKYPSLRIIVYSMSEERVYAERVALAGASGYVMKTAEPSILKQAIQAVLQGHLFFEENIQQRLVRREKGKPTRPQSLLDNLSNREMDVFQLIGQGLNTVKIGSKLDISRNTVDTHRINIKRKLELSSGKALDRMAYEVVMLGKMPKV
jgi:DNA-binding NarL/FixJ family response regulator